MKKKDKWTSCVLQEERLQHKVITYKPFSQKGGDPAAPSGTTTLLRLHPPYQTYLRHRPPYG